MHLSDYLLGFLSALITISLSTAALFLARQELNTSTISQLYLIPVLISTILWGLWPGIFSAFTAFLAYNFFFIPPYYTFTVHNNQDIVALIIFLVVAVVISQLVGRTRSGLAAAVARENETIHLYRLGLELAGVNDIKELASVITRNVAETVQSTEIELSLQPIYGKPAFQFTIPEARQESGKPDQVIPLETVRGFLGEMRLWLGGRRLGVAEERLIKAFAIQGALALERVALAHMETQAKILEESDHLKSILLSSVSHEFRTPLSTIKAATTSLLSGDIAWDEPARTDLLMAVDEEADYLNYLVGNLLDMSRIEAGALKPKRQWNDLSEIVDSAVDRLHRKLDHFQLQIDIPEDFPLIPVDYYQLEQVFTNLVNNSVKYAPKGSKIQIAAFLQDQDLATIKVVNEGPQVTPDHIDRIFDKFYRITAPEKVSGTGLGLSICKGIIEAHGGRIWAENITGGLAFVFSLPLTLDGSAPPSIDTYDL